MFAPTWPVVQRYAATPIVDLRCGCAVHGTLEASGVGQDGARRGNSTLAARHALLDAHRIEVEGKVADMRAMLEILRTKIALYDRVQPR